MSVSRRIPSVALVSALSALVLPAALKADAKFDHFVERQRYDINQTVAFENPCNGEPTIATLEGQGHLILVSDGAGGAHVNLAETHHGGAVGESGARYVVAETVMGSGNATLHQGSQVVTAVATVHFISVDGGQNYIAHGVARIITTPNGTTREFEFTSTECRG